MLKLSYLLAFICTFQIINGNSQPKLLKLDYFRAEIISIEKVLWQKIMEYDSEKYTLYDESITRTRQYELIKRVLVYHTMVTFNKSSPLLENYTRESFHMLDNIPEWLNIECDIMTVSNKFNDFRELLIETNGIAVEDILDRVKLFAGNILSSTFFTMGGILTKIKNLMEHKTINIFYEEVINVSIVILKTSILLVCDWFWF